MRRVLYGVILGLAVVAAMAVALEFYGSKQRAPVVTGEALVGGPFTLIDSGGARVSSANFAGRHMLIFFGYSNCPDVCPLALQKMSMALDMLEQEGIGLAPLQPIFITIDPSRDTPAVMAKYISAFHPAFIALTGSADAIAGVAKAYRVHSARATSDEGDHEMEDEQAEGYMMNHSAVIYLMGPEGRYVDHFNSIATPRDIAERLRAILD